MKNLRDGGAYTIGQVSKLSGVGIEAIRFYEREGVIPKPPRTESGYRLYPADILRRLHFIKRAQELGFSLREISQLIAIRVTAKSNCGEVKRRAEKKLDEIEQKIKDLKKMQVTLKKVTEACIASRPIEDCPILKSFDSF